MRWKFGVSLLALLLFVFLFTGCSISKVSTEKSNSGGSGLEISFDIDTRFVPSTGLLYGIIKLKNTGFKDIKLSPENVELVTTTRDLFKEDPNVIIRNVFNKYGEITLVQGAEPYTFSFQIPVNKEYINDIVNSYGDLSLKITYPYRTVVNNNIHVDTSDPTSPISFLDSLNQAAPVKVSKVDSITVEGNRVQLNIYFSKEDLGTQSYIDDFKCDLNIGGEPLSCEPFVFSTEKPLICKFAPKSNNYNTIFSGTLSYKYTMIISKRIDLQELRDKMRGY